MEDVRARFGLSGSTLKLIAIITMLIDHVAYAVIWMGIIDGTMGLTEEQVMEWYRIYYLCRMIGRISFPIFAFLLVEGFVHTRDIKRYTGRLFLFALISEVAFDLAFQRVWLEFGYQNIYFTLTLGVMAMWAMKTYLYSPEPEKRLLAVLLVGACCFGASILRTDYDVLGVLMIVAMYLFRDSRVGQTISGCLLFLGTWTAMLSFIPINLYNGKKGFSLKYFFYLFYPVHLLVLVAIRTSLLQ